MTKRLKKPKYYLKTFNMARKACEKQNQLLSKYAEDGDIYVFHNDTEIHGITKKKWKELREELYQPIPDTHSVPSPYWATIQYSFSEFFVPIVALTKLGKSCL